MQNTRSYDAAGPKRRIRKTYWCFSNQSLGPDAAGAIIGAEYRRRAACRKTTRTGMDWSRRQYSTKPR